jgi:pyruvate/2-oxoglutarate dehydrogenase complex dihydrolipoamide acyltransferase (E2) component
LTIPSILDEPIVKDGKVVAGRVVHLTTTFDHRVLDGVQAARMCQDLTELLTNPETLDDAP